jgi:hypothetical protein
MSAYLWLLFVGDRVERRPRCTSDNMQDWRGIREKAREVDSITRDEASRWTLNECCINISTTTQTA